MTMIKIDPMDHPLLMGESWWVVHPNDGKAELRIPIGAPAVCKEPFVEKFTRNVPYRIVDVNDAHGWVSVEGKDRTIVEMPRYVFARYFDAVAYIKCLDGERERLSCLE